MVHQGEFSISGHFSRTSLKGSQIQLFPLFLSMSFFLLNFLSPSLLAQTGRLGGTIVSNATASPLPEIHVFIPNTTFQAFSDENGNFQLTNLPEGTWELQVRGLGWEKFSQ